MTSLQDAPVLPPGYRLVQCSNGDVMLMRDEWTEGPHFSSVDMAILYAHWIESGEACWQLPVQGQA